jgi:hypothetical protein
MFIAFEGPDNVGKSTSAQELDVAGMPDYNMTKAGHAQDVADWVAAGSQPDGIHTYDRIDWFSHMVYRLAMPDKDWNDDRPRTVFAMPDTHLVVKLHRPDLANFTVAADDESAATASRTRGVETPVAIVNQTYYYFADFFTGLNEERDYALFKSVTLIEVENWEQGYSQRLASFSSPATQEEQLSNAWFTTITNAELLELLRFDDAQRG